MLVEQLRSLLRRPWPGCILIHAPSHSDQQRALDDVRDVALALSQQLDVAEAHPSLLSSKLALDLQRLFTDNKSATPSLPRLSLAVPFNSIYPAQEASSRPRLLTVPCAQLLRETHHTSVWSQLLHPPLGYTVVLVSSLTLDRWRTTDGIEDTSGHRPIVQLYLSDASDSKRQLPQATLNDSLPSASVLADAFSVERSVAESMSAKPRSLYVTWAAAAFESQIGEWDTAEVLYLLAPIWIATCRIVSIKARDESVRAQLFGHLSHGPALFAIANPLLRSALHELHTRRQGTRSWIEQQVATYEQTDGEGCNGSAAASTSSAVGTTASPKQSLSPLAALLLLAAFLASHLPARSDVRFFLRDEAIIPNFSARRKGARRRARRRTGADDGDGADAETRSNSHTLLLGPRPFALPRLLAIFQNLAAEFGLFRCEASSSTTEWQAARNKRVAGVDDDSRKRKRLRRPSRLERDRASQSAIEIALHSLTVHHVLQELISRNLVIALTPPAAEIVVPYTAQSGSHGDDSRARDTAALGAVPSRLEWLNHVTLRCNCLRQEVRDFVLGTESSTHTDGRQTQPTAASWSRIVGLFTEGAESEDEGLQDGLNMPRRRTGHDILRPGLFSGGVGGANGTTALDTKLHRREWWARLEEVGL